ncbi:MAG: family 78 glycoside hydrolase catalytic domain [Limisphaerales bacterium]
MKISIAKITLPLILVLAAAGGQARDLKVEGLRCEYLVNPLGVDSPQPRLSWTLDSKERGQVQTAYQLLVAGSPRGIVAMDGLTGAAPLIPRGDWWNTGKVKSDQTIGIVYGGQPLRSGTRVFWKVRVWDKDGQASAWSEPAFWQMGLLEAKDWQARWIAAETSPAPARPPLPLLRREFQVTRSVQRATVFVCGLGFYELRLNGEKVGDQVLDPGWTNYRKTCLYATYDVTGQIVRGANAFGVMLGNGMYNVTGGRYVKFTGSYGPPKLILQLRLDFADGTSTQVVTDESWRGAPGPLTFSCIYGGEDCDARREQAGWDKPGFNDSAWQPAAVVEGPGGRLVSQSDPPIKLMNRFKTVKVTEPRPGVFVYDLGQNFSGWPQLTVRGPAGATVKLTPGELLEPNGLVSQRSSGGPTYFSYTLKGEGIETWHPRFSYYGFRYVQVEGGVPRDRASTAVAQPVVLGLEGQFIHSSARTVGRFECSNALLNRIHSLVLAAIESNLQSVLTDCPHREKLGWLEVSHLLGPAIMFNYDVPALYAKICRDMAASQLENGLVPDIAPEYTVFGGGFRDSPEWGSACAVNPWLLYQRYGDTSALAQNYDVIARYVGYLGRQAKDHIVSHGLGDWYDIGPKPPGESQLTTKGLTATAIYYQDIEILGRTAALLGKNEDARKWTALAAEVRRAFNARFFNAATSQYDRGSQTANAMPLVLGLVEPGDEAAVLASLVKDVRSRGNQVTAGDIGFRYLVEALRTGGHSDVLFDLVTRRDGPGYAMQLAKGATTLTEAWDADAASSQNHCMLGHVEEWFYTGLGGINPDPTGPGFRKLIIKPQIVGDLTWVRVSYEYVSGTVRSAWQIDKRRLLLDVTIPPNTTAMVYVPTLDAAKVTEGGKPAAKVKGVEFVRQENRAAVYHVGPGVYRFTAPYSKPPG